MSSTLAQDGLILQSRINFEEEVDKRVLETNPETWEEVAETLEDAAETVLGNVGDISLASFRPFICSLKIN